MSNIDNKTNADDLSCKTSILRQEEFWMNNPKELYRNNNYLKFFPKYDTTRTEQLNAITRMCIYFALLIIIFNRDNRWLYLPISIVIVVILIHNIHENDENGKPKELDKILNVRKERRAIEQDKIKEQFKHDGEQKLHLDIDPEEEIKNYELEAGYINPDGEFEVGPKLEIPNIKDESENSLFRVDEIDIFKKNTCRKPTKDNPFMNPNIYDYNNGHIPVACNVEDDDIKEDIAVNFNHELFRDVDELWERKNSQRQFYTIPNTAVPNNQKEFANWLYKTRPTCKEDHAFCDRTIFDPLRFRRRQ